MKQLICIVAALLLILGAAAQAESIDLSGLSFEELAQLRDRCQLEMLKRDEWQQVTVPQGVWRVGVDIPAGKWMIKCPDNARNDYLMRLCWLMWGSVVEDNLVPSRYRKGEVEVYNPNAEDYKAGQVTEYVITLEDGDLLLIHPSYNKAVFIPYTGKPDLGFK